MSATTELLLEQIRQQEDAVRAAAEMGHDTKSMREELARLKKKLVQANQALNEDKQLLKS
jgi:Mg2+ and Co2+ transporter CorA